MITKTIEFTDYNGMQRKEKYHFNLSKAELMRLEMSYPGGLEKTIKCAIRNGDNATIFNLFETVILKAYGKINDDGGFTKSEKLMTDFSQSEAYSEFLMELITDPTGDKFAKFFRGAIPKDYSAKLPNNIAELAAKELED